MCVTVNVARTDGPEWSAEDVCIDVPPNLTHGQTALLVREILAELGTPQPAESTMEAVCFCGAPVKVTGLTPCRSKPVLRIPRQRGGVMEVSRGA